MKKHTIVFLFALCPLIPAASRFSYGLILCFALIWLFLSGLLFRELIKKIVPDDAGFYLELVCIAASATVFYQVLEAVFPVLAVSLGLYIFISSFSYLVITSIDRFSADKESFLPIVSFFPILLVFSLIREIFGFGTISFPVPSGFIEFTVLPYFEQYGLGFWGTAGGALILIGIFSWLVKYVNRRASIVKRNVK